MTPVNENAKSKPSQPKPKTKTSEAQVLQARNAEPQASDVKPLEVSTPEVKKPKEKKPNAKQPKAEKLEAKTSYARTSKPKTLEVNTSEMPEQPELTAEEQKKLEEEFPQVCYQIGLVIDNPSFGILDRNINHAECKRILSRVEKPTYEMKVLSVEPSCLRHLWQCEDFKPIVPRMTTRHLNTLSPGLRFSKTGIYPRMEKTIHTSPTTLCITVRSRKEANHKEIETATENCPIFMIRGLLNACGINSSVFHTANLENRREDQIETRIQDYCDNVTSWNCRSSDGGEVPVSDYVEHQKEEFKKDQKSVFESLKRNTSKQFLQKDELRFGTNLDMKNDGSWQEQFNELNKLPLFLRVSCPEKNMLDHTGKDIAGMNVPQLYIKTIYVKTPAHQENNSFSSININIGPGSCQWLAVPYEYWPRIEALCEEKGIDFMRGTYWPNPEELKALGIPVYEFIQEAGDVVYVSAGCVHWVKSLGYCNNVAWNVGPITRRQLLIALRSMEYNSQVAYPSLVPLQSICWNMVKAGIKIRDRSMLSTMDEVLSISLQQVKAAFNYLDSKDVDITLRQIDRTNHNDICGKCNSEAFYYIFELAQGGIRCWACLEKEDIFTSHIIAYRSLDELEMLYSKFNKMASKMLKRKAP